MRYGTPQHLMEDVGMTAQTSITSASRLCNIFSLSYAVPKFFFFSLSLSFLFYTFEKLAFGQCIGLDANFSYPTTSCTRPLHFGHTSGNGLRTAAKFPCPLTENHAPGLAVQLLQLCMEEEEEK